MDVVCFLHGFVHEYVFLLLLIPLKREDHIVQWSLCFCLQELDWSKSTDFWCVPFIFHVVITSIKLDISWWNNNGCFLMFWSKLTEGECPQSSKQGLVFTFSCPTAGVNLPAHFTTVYAKGSEVKGKEEAIKYQLGTPVPECELHTLGGESEL